MIQRAPKSKRPDTPFPYTTLFRPIEAEGGEVLGVTSYGDLSSFAQQQSRASAFILSIDDEEFDVDSPEDVAYAIKNLRTFIGELRLDRKSTRLNSSH